MNTEINQQEKRLLWEEKNLKEPLLKLENNGVLDGNDIIPLTKIVLSNIKEIDTTNQNKTRNCVMCNKEFIHAKFHPNQIFCSDKCKSKHRWPGNRKITKNICKGCSKEFIGGRYQYNRQMYCNVKCQETHHRSKDEVKLKRKLRHNHRMKTDINYKLSCLLRIRLNKALKGDYKSGSAIKDLGCSVGELKLYLESKFIDGMSWENHGQWHIDHIKPFAMFNLSDRQQLLKSCHYTNLQPLWAEDNLLKSNKLTIDTSQNTW